MSTSERHFDATSIDPSCVDLFVLPRSLSTDSDDASRVRPDSSRTQDRLYPASRHGRARRSQASDSTRKCSPVSVQHTRACRRTTRIDAPLGARLCLRLQPDARSRHWLIWTTTCHSTRLLSSIAIPSRRLMTFSSAIALLVSPQAVARNCSTCVLTVLDACRAGSRHHSSTRSTTS